MRIKIESFGCGLSNSSKVYDEAMANIDPSWLKAMEEMDVGYLWNWHNLFLFFASQTLTMPSPPPVANVP